MGATHPDGSTLPGLEEAAAAELAAQKEAALASDGFDKNHELLFGPRRTVLLVLLLVVLGIAVWAFVRWSAKRRRERYRRLKGKGRRRGLKGKGIRLEQRERDEREERSSREYSDFESRGSRRVGAIPAPLETAQVFDVGEDDDTFGDEGFEHLERDTEEDALDEEGDLGRAENPWRALE